jgi:catechol 2,3-dioxygenase-like lactoylglutathione lyase family enzyme
MNDFALKVVVRCADLEKSRHFYLEILEFPLLEAWQEPEGKGCIFGFGQGGSLEIYQMSPHDRRFDPAFTRPFVHDKVDLQFGTGSLDRWIVKLANRWPFDGPETLPWGHRWIKLRDPDKLLIAVFEAPAQK